MSLETNNLYKIIANWILIRAYNAFWDLIHPSKNGMRYTLHHLIYLKAVKSNMYVLYFDLVWGIKETPGVLLFPISSDETIDFFSVEMKACFNNFLNCPDNLSFQAIRKKQNCDKKNNTYFSCSIVRQCVHFCCHRTKGRTEVILVVKHVNFWSQMKTPCEVVGW